MNETWLIPKHPNSSPKLKSLQDLSIRIKAKVTEETADHIGLRVNGGPKLPPPPSSAWVIQLPPSPALLGLPHN
jgi:hypothetical protein